MKKTILKKNILKKLALLACDGDPETAEMLAEAVEEIVESPSADPENTVVIAAETRSEPAPADPTEENEPVPGSAADCGMLSAVLEKLDQLIALLTPAAPAADEDVSGLPEELAEVVEEALEAAETEETIGAEPVTPEDVSAMMAEITNPEVSGVVGPEAEESSQDCGPDRETADAIRTAFRAFRPVMKYIPGPERRRLCADVARRMKRSGSDAAVYAALARTGARRPAADCTGLGKQIMARRNPNYKK